MFLSLDEHLGCSVEPRLLFIDKKCVRHPNQLDVVRSYHQLLKTVLNTKIYVKKRERMWCFNLWTCRYYHENYTKTINIYQIVIDKMTVHFIKRWQLKLKFVCWSFDKIWANMFFLSDMTHICHLKDLCGLSYLWHLISWNTQN